MKKIRLILIPIVLVVCSFLLYNNIIVFQYANISKITITNSDISLELDKSMETVETVISGLDALRKYETANQVNSIIDYELVLDMKYGTDKEYVIHLDHNFEDLYITDKKSSMTYKVDDEIVELIYMMNEFNDIYDYNEFEYHDILFDNVLLETSHTNEWKYLKADNKWYENSETSNIKKMMLTLNEPEDLFTFDYSKDPSNVELIVRYNDEVIHESDLNESFIPKKNGIYEYEVTSKWKSELYSGKQVSKFDVKCTYEPDFSISKTEIERGEFISIKANNIIDPELLYINQEISGKVTFRENGDYYEAIIPATYYTDLGFYTIEYGYGDIASEVKNIEVIDREFSIQHLTVNETTVKSTKTTEGYAQYRKYYKASLQENVYESEIDFTATNNFILPVVGRLTTEFGERRYVNGAPTSYNHAGFDIAASRGTEVKATFDGQVVLAMELTVTGNSVVINHGSGIFSTYFHLNEFNVEEGEEVKTGQIIGKVGSTGFSTGPHLHFSLSFYDMNLEPGYFIYGKKITYDNYKEYFYNE